MKLLSSILFLKGVNYVMRDFDYRCYFVVLIDFCHITMVNNAVYQVLFIGSQYTLSQHKLYSTLPKKKHFS